MGANDPIYIANTPSSDLNVAAVTRYLGLMLADRSGGSILANPTIGAAFENWEALNVYGTQKVAMGWGMSKMTAKTEGSNYDIFTLDSDKSTLSPTEFGFARKMSDHARFFSGQPNALDWINFARDGEWAFGQSAVDGIAALAGSISATGGNTGGNDSWGLVFDDMLTLRTAKVAGPYVLLSTSKQWGKVQKDALALGGAVQMDPNTLAFMQAAGYGFQGAYMNGQLYVYVTDELDVNVGDTVGMMFGMEFLRWTAAAKPKSPAAIELMRTPLWAQEIGRDALKSEDVVVTSNEMDFAIHINAAGIKRPFLT